MIEPNRVTKKHLCEEEKLRIIRLKERKYTIEAIADIYEIDRSTVIRIINKFKITGTVKKNNISIDNKIKININDQLVDIIKNYRGITLNEIKSKLKIDHNIQCSKSIISEKLHKMGYDKKLPQLKPLLTEQHLNDRQYWAIFYSGFDWSSVIWSDETKICNDSNNYQKLWINQDETIIKSKLKYPLKINVWGAIIQGKSIIFKIFEKTMNSQQYENVIIECVLPLFQNNQENKNYIFQQDNAPCHTSLRTIKLFSENKIEVMFW